MRVCIAFKNESMACTVPQLARDGGVGYTQSRFAETAYASSLTRISRKRFPRTQGTRSPRLIRRRSRSLLRTRRRERSRAATRGYKGLVKSHVFSVLQWYRYSRTVNSIDHSERVDNLRHGVVSVLQPRGCSKGSGASWDWIGCIGRAGIQLVMAWCSTSIQRLVQRSAPAHGSAALKITSAPSAAFNIWMGVMRLAVQP